MNTTPSSSFSGSSGHTAGVPPRAMVRAAPLAIPGARLRARLLDVVFCYVSVIVPAIVVVFATGLNEPNVEPSTAHMVGLALAWLGAFLGFFVIPTARTGRTLGKRIMGIRVARTVTEVPVGLPRALFREVAWLATLVVPVLYLLMLADRQYARCLHDRIADSTVVTSPPSAIRRTQQARRP